MVNLKKNYEITKYKKIVADSSLLLYCVIDGNFNSFCLDFIRSKGCKLFFISNGVLRHGLGLKGKSGSLYLIYGKDIEGVQGLISTLESKFKISILFLELPNRIVIYDYYKSVMKNYVTTPTLIQNLCMQQYSVFYLKLIVIYKLFYLLGLNKEQ